MTTDRAWHRKVRRLLMSPAVACMAWPISTRHRTDTNHRSHLALLLCSGRCFLFQNGELSQKVCTLQSCSVIGMVFKSSASTTQYRQFWQSPCASH